MVQLPDFRAAKFGGEPQSHCFVQPHFSSHATLAAMSLTFKIGVMPAICMWASLAEARVRGCGMPPPVPPLYGTPLCLVTLLLAVSISLYRLYEGVYIGMEEPRLLH